MIGRGLAVSGVRRRTSVYLANGVTLFLSLRDADPIRWESALAAARRVSKRVECLCRDEDRALFTIRAMVSGRSKNKQHVLARYPNSQATHDWRCEFYNEPIDTSGRGGYSHLALSERADGDFAILLEGGINARSPLDDAPNDNSKDFDPCGTRRGKMTLRGALDLLFERERLDRYEPTRKRAWYNITAALLRASAHIHIASRTTMADRIFVATPQPAKAYVADSLARWKAVIDEPGARMIVIGQLAVPPRINEGKTKALLQLADAYRYEGLALFLDRDILAAFANSFEREIAAISKAVENADRVLVIALVDVDRRLGNFGKGNIRALAARRMTHDFIPVESGYEAELARLLVEQGRTFRKPLRYDGSDFFPDFELLDSGTAPIPMEVFGMDTPEYNERKAIKLRLFRERFGDRWWAWNAYLRNPMPKLPVLTE